MSVISTVRGAVTMTSVRGFVSPELLVLHQFAADDVFRGKVLHPALHIVTGNHSRLLLGGKTQMM